MSGPVAARGDDAVESPRRAALTLDRILATAIALADETGYDALSMRPLAERLDVVPMALYKHVRNRDELVDRMVAAVLASISPDVEPGTHWKAAARRRVLAARGVMLRHPWMWRAIETRTSPSPVVLDQQEAMIRTLREGGLSVALVHHAMHALGSRLWGFTQEVYASAPPPTGPQALAAAAAMLAQRWPYVLESAASVMHDSDSIVGPGCDDETEFEFALDLILDGIERLHETGWSPSR